LGVTIDDVIADTAITCIYGDAKSARHIELIKTTEECLAKGIESIKVGKRLGCIGNAIYKHASNKGFGVITNYGGHGISYNTPHEYPFICNKASQEEGEIIQPGLTIAIEPLLCIGSSETKVDKDGWTVCTSNLSAHFEHSIYVHENSVEIIT
jgi:methionyl aminopeptidase